LFGLIPALGTTRGVAAMAASRITSDTTGPARGQILLLAARREQVAVAMTHHALLSLAGGLSAGIVGAVAFGRLASRFLYGIEPTDPASFAVAAAVLGLVTGVAAFVPAWRAARMDPGSILKAE
jgi:putative ABC transport system permease protein